MNKKNDLIALVTILTIVFFLASSTVASATTIYVPDNYVTIQEAVNAANEGAIIIVRNGTYSENINVNKRLTIRSENGSAFTTVIAANSKNHVFTVNTDYVNINGFTVTGVTADRFPEYAAGIYLGWVDYCNISNNNVSYNGDGIWLWNSSSNIIANNTANSNGNIGIFAATISDNNTIINNIANSNNVSGIELWGSNNNMIANNTVSSNDRGIYLWESSGNTLSSNNAGLNKNYGIYLLVSGNNKLQNNTLSSNNYGIYLDKSRNNRLQNNTLLSNNYGIYNMFSSDSITAQNNFIDNKENIYSGTGRPSVFEIIFSIAGLLAMLYIAFKYKRHFSRFGDLSKKAIIGLQVFIIILNIFFYLSLTSQNLWLISFNLIFLLVSKVFGIFIFALGIFIIFWSLYSLIKEVFVHENKLIVKGPYAFVRHPMYFGWIIGAVGLALFANSLIGLIYSFILALNLSYISEYEEEDLRTRFGHEYVEYLNKVPKLFPFGM